VLCAAIQEGLSQSKEEIQGWRILHDEENSNFSPQQRCFQNHFAAETSGLIIFDGSLEK
jgi:hypothetical protein